MGNTILIAEDDEAPLKYLKQFFTASGFTVYTADSCRDTIRLACRHLPDCFLLDYHLKDDIVIPACLFIRDHDQLKDAPIVIYSGDDSQAMTSYSAGQADVFIDKTKPCAEILAALEHLLRRRERSRGPSEPKDLTLDVRGMRILKAGVPLARLSDEQFRLFNILGLLQSEWVFSC